MEQSERLHSASVETHSINHPSSPITHGAGAHSGVTKELTIPRFYAGKSVFVTGVTGFMGKVLLEKLLRCCPDVEAVYCLVRHKNKKDIAQRLKELTDSKMKLIQMKERNRETVNQKQVFDKLRSEQPEFCKKIVPVYGDIMEPELGISEDNIRMLQDTIHIIFHSAATIRFDEHLRIATEMNVKGVQKMIKLCRTFKHLEAFVHVSTAYANCDHEHIEETVYKPTVDPQKILDILEWMEDDMVEMLTQKLLKKKPNTYTFTKQLAEWILLKEGDGLPIAIVRPSIVGATWKEPFPGWIDNLNGPGALAVAYGKGLLRSLRASYSGVADIIPMDFPINVMIAVAWYTAIARPRQLMVYNSTIGTQNPFTWGEIESNMVDCFKRTPLDSCFRRPRKLVITGNSYVHNCLMHVSLIPAYVMDLGLRVVGKKSRMVKIYSKMHKALNTLEFFTCNSWTWSSNNLDMLRHQLTPEDLKTFCVDPQSVHWPTYIEIYCLGIKKYLLKEDMADLPAARAHLRMLRNIRYMFNTLIAVALWRTLIARSQIARNLWYLIVKLVFKFVSYFGITSTM